MNKVSESITQMSLDFHKRMAEFEAKLQKEPGTPTTISSLTAEFEAFKLLTMQSLTNLQQQVEAVTRSIDVLEMHGRRKILLFHGIVEDKKEDTAQVVSSIIRERLEQEHFNVKDIKRCQRLGRQSGTQKTRPILVKLQSVSVRDSIWFSKTKLKGSGITISEFLTKARHDIFMAARERYGVNNCWTRQGHVYVLGPDAKQQRISSLVELNRIVDSGEKPAATAKAVTTKSKRAAAKK